MQYKSGLKTLPHNCHAGPVPASRLRLQLSAGLSYLTSSTVGMLVPAPWRVTAMDAALLAYVTA